MLSAAPAGAQTRPEGTPPPAQDAAPPPDRPRAVPQPLEPERRPWAGEDADEDGRPAPFSQGCPDRGNKLELIV
jgi:hypothetical protein